MKKDMENKTKTRAVNTNVNTNVNTKTRIVIGDIHGHWDVFDQIYKEADPDEVILLGDYCDSFVKTAKDVVECWNNIQRLRKKHEKTRGKFIMLVGNHEWHYINSSYERYSGFNTDTFNALYEKLKEASESGVMHVAYADTVNKVIYSHAGVTNAWLESWSNPPVDMLDDVNKRALNFFMGGGDPYGNSKWQGPLWVRPEALIGDMYKDDTGHVWTQIVGHTRTGTPLVCSSDGENMSSEPDKGALFVIDTLPQYYIKETLDNDGAITKREIVKRDIDDSFYMQ